MSHISSLGRTGVGVIHCKAVIYCIVSVIYFLSSEEKTNREMDYRERTLNYSHS